MHDVLVGGGDLRLRFQERIVFVDKFLILAVNAFIIYLRSLPPALHLRLDRRRTAQASQRDRIIFHGRRVNEGLLSDYGGPAAVYLDELAPDFLLHRLVVQLDDELLPDRRLLLDLRALVPVRSIVLEDVAV